ncbi:hypothetical protein [Paracraurococcus lichenis]|uniref:Transcriptional regulator n=1 Tax=Paracraurococcus lichenis TaxID=3064888 RepID=A0ABT9E847_9PROT|nr:hypothetical protein [Paracraurococcus sp. LOR1-02]MDO9712378.1 hypothetical protein [Paracraurococcus sp. LOR1-02]
MTQDRFEELLGALHWGERTLAVVLGEHWTTVRRWRADPTRMPDNVERWLEHAAKSLLAHPLPKGWTPQVSYEGRKRHGQAAEED